MRRDVDYIHGLHIKRLLRVHHCLIRKAKQFPSTIGNTLMASIRESAQTAVAAVGGER